MPLLVRALVNKYYPNYRDDQFAARVSEHNHSASRVLEIGAGSGWNHQNHFALRGKVASYVGVDPDPAVLGNPFWMKACAGGAEALPFSNESFDLVFHNFVTEHFEFPEQCNREIYRILKPGGLVLFRTPNRYYYASLAASVTPHWFHEFYVQRFGSGRNEGEVFPTYYRLHEANTIVGQMQSCGFMRPKIEHHSLPPGYLRFNKFAFLAGIAFERTFEQWIPALRAQIIVLARKLVVPNPSEK